jgi:hypothetical protein
MALTYGSIDKSKDKVVIVKMRGGYVVEVIGLPEGYRCDVIREDDPYEEEEEK